MSLHQAGLQTLDAIDVVESANPGTYTPGNGAVYPNTGHPPMTVPEWERVLGVVTDDETRAGAAFGLATACDRLARYRAAWAALGDE